MTDQFDPSEEIYLRVEMEDGSWWDVPGKIIASARASSFTPEAVHSDDELEQRLNIMYETLRDEELLIDWAEVNMEWKDIVPFARQVRSSRNSSYDSDWLKGMKQVVKEYV